MGHNCDCHHDHEGHDCNHGNNYYFWGYPCGEWRFCESDGTIVGTIFLIIGIIVILVELFA